MRLKHISPIIIMISGPIRLVSAEHYPWDTSSLYALAMIETGVKDNAVGKQGERSRYQIKEVTWKRYTNSSFKHYAKDRSIATEVAMLHIISLINEYKKARGIPPSVYEVYLMWNLGLAGYKKYGFDMTKVPRKYMERAERYYNLVKLLENKN